MIYDTITSRTVVEKDRSRDKKYGVTTIDGTKYLLRITQPDKSESRDILKKVAELGIPICKPVEFGDCNEGAYRLYSWVEGQDDFDGMIKQSQDVLSWYNNMQLVAPIWYLKNVYTQYINGIPFKLKSSFDFSFLSKYGKVFKVFDDQDSGNICFGVEKDGKKYFVKFAGAPTARGIVSIDEAIQNLAGTTTIYRELAHTNLIELIKAEHIGGGFAMVFRWEKRSAWVGCIHCPGKSSFP